MKAPQWRTYLHRRWVCQVVRSGFHNGARCHPGDGDHAGWRCGFRWELSLPDTPETRTLLGVPEE